MHAKDNSCHAFRTSSLRAPGCEWTLFACLSLCVRLCSLSASCVRLRVCLRVGRVGLRLELFFHNTFIFANPHAFFAARHAAILRAGFVVGFLGGACVGLRRNIGVCQDTCITSQPVFLERELRCFLFRSVPKGMG